MTHIFNFLFTAEILGQFQIWVYFNFGSNFNVLKKWCNQVFQNWRKEMETKHFLNASTLVLANHSGGYHSITNTVKSHQSTLFGDVKSKKYAKVKIRLVTISSKEPPKKWLLIMTLFIVKLLKNITMGTSKTTI